MDRRYNTKVFSSLPMIFLILNMIGCQADYNTSKANSCQLYTTYYLPKIGTEDNLHYLAFLRLGKLRYMDL